MRAASAGDLVGRVALVVGGTGRIGRAACADLATRGATVAVGYRRNAGAARTIADEVGGSAVRIIVDQDASVDDAFGAIESAHGPVGVLVDTAHADMPPVPVADLDRQTLAAHLDAVQGFAALVRRAVPGMRAERWGRIIYVSGALMSRPAPGFAGYGAAKAAATTLTRYVAVEEGRAGITANIVAPGRVHDEAEQLDDTRRELAARLLERAALGVFPTVDEVAATIGLLAASAHLTGQTIWVTGGEPIIA
jgi:NAD(P)-dependent dehydrogenase (short-subunit alcohol dehydrogenase family)